MKTFSINILGLLLVAGLTGLNTDGYSQDQDKKSRKEERKIQKEADFRLLESILYSGRYVLEADFLQSKYGERISVTSNLNFIMVNGQKGVLQTGSDFYSGYNGVGGVTAEGNILDYKVSKDTKSLTLSVRFHLMTNLGSYDILMRIDSNNNAAASISGTTSGKLTWDGRLVPLDNSRVFKGQNTI